MDTSRVARRGVTVPPTPQEEGTGYVFVGLREWQLVFRLLTTPVERV